MCKLTQKMYLNALIQSSFSEIMLQFEIHSFVADTL